MQYRLIAVLILFCLNAVLNYPPNYVILFSSVKTEVNSMPLTLAICDDNENQIKESRRLLDELSADKPFALTIDEYISAESKLYQNIFSKPHKAVPKKE